MKGICETFANVCSYETDNIKNYTLEVSVPKTVQAKARALLKSRRRGQFLKVSDGVYKYREYTIDILQRSCKCVFYLKYATCKH